MSNGYPKDLRIKKACQSLFLSHGECSWPEENERFLAFSNAMISCDCKIPCTGRLINMGYEIACLDTKWK